MVAEWSRCARLTMLGGIVATLTLGILGCASSGVPEDDAVNSEADLRVLERMASVRTRIDMLVIAEEDLSGEAISVDLYLELERDLASKVGLAVIADHFFDERLTCPFGSFESGTPTARGYTIGDSLFLMFQRAFYPNSYPIKKPPCLRSKSLALKWIADHKYDLAALIADFEKTRER